MTTHAQSSIGLNDHDTALCYIAVLRAQTLSRATGDHKLEFVGKYTNSMAQLHHAETHSRADKPAWHHICPFLL